MIKLSPRQSEIAIYVRLGWVAKDISRKLNLSPKTVETHTTAMKNKLGVKTRGQLVLILNGIRIPQELQEYKS